MPLCMRPALAAVALLALAIPAVAAGTMPDLKGTISVNAGKIGGRERRYLVYVPPNLMPGAPLLIVLHGGGGDGPTIRQGTGFEFDMLADANGFVVVYPDGIGQGWNTCRKRVDSTARREHIDDVGFIEAIIAYEATRHGIDRGRVFATGHSFGGQMSFRLALERPNEFAGIAAVSSDLPASSDMDCTPAQVPIPTMIMNGTDDPVNPYRGGNSGRERNGGIVMSTEATAAWFAKLNGLAGMPETIRLPHREDSDPTWVEKSTWSGGGKPPVVLYTIHNGGHVVPQPYYRYPNIVGRQTKDLDAPAAIWDFFAGLPRRPL